MAVMSVIFAAGALLALQQIPGAGKDPVIEIRGVRPDREGVRVGETFRIAFDLEVPAGYHVYPAGRSRFRKKPTTFQSEAFEPAGEAEEPSPRRHKDPFDEYDYHEGRVTISVPVRLKPGPAPGPLQVEGKAVYEMCNEEQCVAGSTPFSFKVTVLEGAVRAADPEYESRGLLGLILLGILGGVISLIMPCTYPLVPITITYFVKQAAGSRAHGLWLSTLYSLGIVLSFTGIGFLLSMFLGAGGARMFAANPWVNIVVGVLFLWFTGSLFGWYEIQLPFGLGTKLAGGPRKGSGGAFILGLLFSVVTFTCTIPIAATILSIAAGQHRMAALLAMVAYSVTMAVPFFLMGLFPGMVKEVPKSGGWLHTVKVTMAWVELALAVFYFSKADQSWGFGILSRPLMVGAWVGVSLVAAVYLLGMFRTRPAVVRSVFAALFLAFGGYVASGFGGRSLGFLEILVPPPTVHNTTLPEAMARAREKGLPLFAEFTGVTCTNCMANRGTILAAPEVKDRLRRYHVADLWTDLDTEASRANNRLLNEQYGAALPLYILFTPDGKEIARIGGRPSVQKFLEFLDRGLEVR
jgi:thiol:disulfide interchange protein DsbD